MVLQNFKKNFQELNKTYFNIINLFVLASCLLFYCLISISILSRFKNRKRERERERERKKKKEKFLVYIFVRETQIFIDKHKARCWLLLYGTKIACQIAGVNTKTILPHMLPHTAGILCECSCPS